MLPHTHTRLTTYSSLPEYVATHSHQTDYLVPLRTRHLHGFCCQSLNVLNSTGRLGWKREILVWTPPPPKKNKTASGNDTVAATTVPGVPRTGLQSSSHFLVNLAEKQPKSSRMTTIPDLFPRKRTKYNWALLQSSTGFVQGDIEQGCLSASKPCVLIIQVHLHLFAIQIFHTLITNKV